MEMSLDWNDAIFCKTAKAQEELALRSHGLRPKARQLLVLLDGVRTLGSLNKLMAAHELHTLARELKDSGFISVETLPAEPNPVAAEPPAITRAEKPATAEESPDPVRLTRAKAYLIEISQLHLGLLAAKLQQEIAERGQFFGWQALVPIILMSSVIGAIIGIAMKIFSSLREGGYIPFGPFLVGAGLTAMVFGPNAILGTVLGLFGL